MRDIIQELIDAACRAEELFTLDELEEYAEMSRQKREYTATELQSLTGFSVAHLNMLAKREVIPWGRKEGNNRIYPAEVLDILRARGKRKRGAQPTPELSLEDLL